MTCGLERAVRTERESISLAFVHEVEVMQATTREIRVASTGRFGETM